MTLRIPTAVVSAVVASALTAMTLVAFNATAAPQTQPSLRNIRVQQGLLEAELSRLERRAARIDATTQTINARDAVMFYRQGRSNINYGTPYYLLQQIYCQVSHVSPCYPSPSR